MAKHKRSSKRPQPQHKKQKKSQHDKHQRLRTPNPKRKKTIQAKVPLTGRMQTAVAALQAVMSPRIAFRLAILISGMLLADGRRTASAWFVAGGVQDDWDRFYDCLIRVGSISAKLGLVVDGAYAARPFLLPLLAMKIIVVGRLRRDARLQDLPPQGSHPNRIYGKNKISLAKRAGHRQGWSNITYSCRGTCVTRQYKTFLATSKLISGPLRVVIVRFEEGGWAPYFCTDTSAKVRDILEAVAARWAIEEHFHDVKEVWGAGQQQVRNVWSNIGCWNLNGWVYTLVELCCWDQAQAELTDRSDRPWDNPERRPSHADRRRTIAREMLRKPILAALPRTLNNTQFHTLLEHVIALAA